MSVPTVQITNKVSTEGPQLKQNSNFRSHEGTDVYRNKSTKKTE